jgi:diguanylate cyclase (GGDEF)-like protein
MIAVSVGYTVYLAISNVVAEQSRIQHKSISPVFALMDREILKPLYISEVLANGELFNHLIEAEEPDQDQIYNLLEKLEEKFDLEFFIASEKHRRQYFSSRISIELVEGVVDWYFKIRDMKQNLVADVGQRDDPQLFFDVKIYDKTGEYIGMVGVGKSLVVFLDKFTEFKRRHGYNFLFINEQEQVVLSSYPQQLKNGSTLENINDFPWYQDIDQSRLVDDSLNSVLVNIDGDDFLISELEVEELKWRLVLLMPMKARQAQLNKTLFKNVIMVVSLGSLLFFFIYWIANTYRQGVVDTISVDGLTKVYNREAIHEKYANLNQSTQNGLCLIMLDIDYFKNVNDTYGHNKGDEILKKVADILSALVRPQDAVGRWGGEEFLILIPCKDVQVGLSVAERARTLLEQEKFYSSDDSITITASFGVTYTNTVADLIDLVAIADKALYKAKDSGRNKVKYLPFK